MSTSDRQTADEKRMTPRQTRKSDARLTQRARQLRRRNGSLARRAA